MSHIKEVGTQYEFPEGTYAYTTVERQEYLFDKLVSIESFWLRLHRSPETFRTSEIGWRKIWVYNGQTLVAEQ